MAARSRPEALCCPVKPPPALPARERRRLLAVFKALADPTRLEILRLVAAQPGPVCACDVVDRFDLGQPTVSHHLKVLRDAGLLRGSRRGLWSFYEVEPGGLALLAGAAASCCGDAALRAAAGEPSPAPGREAGRTADA